MRCSQCGDEISGDGGLCTYCDSRQAVNASKGGRGQSAKRRTNPSNTKRTGVKESDAGSASNPSNNLNRAAATAANAPPNYAKWAITTPLSSMVFAVGSLFSVLASVCSFVASVLDFAKQLHEPGIWKMVMMIAFAVLLAICDECYKVTKQRTFKFPSLPFLPVMTGWGGKLGFAAFSGRCKCGGRLRFYDRSNKPIEDDADGKATNLAESHMMAQCVREPKKHVWSLGHVKQVLSA